MTSGAFESANMHNRVIHLPVDDPRWVAFVQSVPAAMPFHHPAWAKLLAECYGYRPLALALTDGSGEISAGLPVMDVSGLLGRRRWVSLPFTDYCPVLNRNRSTGRLSDALVDAARTTRLGSFELRAGLPEAPHVYTRADAVRHTLELSSDSEAVYAGFSKMHRRNIRKAEREDVHITRGHSASDVQAFYRLHLLTRRRLGAPVQPKRFFDLLADRLMKNGLGFILTARVNGEPAAAAIFLNWNGTLIYKYGASDPTYWEHRPNNLLFWEAIRWACEQGYHTLDWGRSDLEDRGLRDFKGGWGAHEEPLMYSTISETRPSSSSGRLNRAMGTVIRRSPPWVCRTIGELFYKYAA